MGSASPAPILLVEDELLVAQQQQRALNDHGFAVILCHNQAGALDCVRGGDPIGLILMDVDLGGEPDGIELARQILDIRTVPIVFLTAHAGESTVRRAEELTQYGYVLKSAGEFTMGQSVKTALRLFRAHRESVAGRERFQRLFDGTPTIAIQGYRPDGTVTYWNRASEELYGYPADEAIGGNLLELIIPPPMRSEVESLIERFVATGEPIPPAELTLMAKGGRPVDVYSSHTLVRGDDGETELFCLDMDIGERRRTEEALNRREREYRLLVEHQRELVVRVDADGRFEFVSESYCRLFGKTREELIGHSFVPLVHEDDREATRTAMEALYRPPYECRLEQRALTRDGWRWLEWEDSAILDDEGRVIGIVGAGRDVTERKEAEAALRESETRLRTILDRLPIPVVISRAPDETVTTVNRRFEEVFGYTMDEMPDVEAWYRLAFPDPEYRRRVAEQWSTFTTHAAAHGGEIGPIEVEATCGDGTVRQIEVRGHAFNGIFMIVFTDMTEVVAVRRRLEQAVDAKDALMKELNHRVKNNLNLVSSMVSLKDDALGGVVDLSDIRGQIDSIALIHEKLHQSSDPGEIQIGSYIQSLLEGAFSFYSGPRVQIENAVPNLAFSSRKAVALGVIVNEMATNAMKHAFRPGVAERFSVAMSRRRGTGECDLVVSNTGQPFPPDVHLDHPDTLGLRLISALVDQLDGTVSLERDPQTAFSVRFPCS